MIHLTEFLYESLKGERYFYTTVEKVIDTLLKDNDLEGDIKSIKADDLEKIVPLASNNGPKTPGVLSYDASSKKLNVDYKNLLKELQNNSDKKVEVYKENTNYGKSDMTFFWFMLYYTEDKKNYIAVSFALKNDSVDDLELEDSKTM